MSELLKKTGEHFISIFQESEEDPDEEVEKLQSLHMRLIADLKAEKSAGEQRKKSISVQHTSELQGIAEEMFAVQSAQDRVKDKLTFFREEAALLEDQIKRAEQLKTELTNTIQSPEVQEELPEDESLDYYKTEVMTSRQVQANLKSVIHSDELLMNDASRQKEQVLELLQSKETEVEKALTVKNDRNKRWTEQVRELQREIEGLKAGRMEADEKDLRELLVSQKRTVETLKNEKSALMIQLESRRVPVVRRAQLVSSRLTDLDFLQVHPIVYKTASFFDELLLDLCTAMDDFAVVKLVLVAYLVILHLWVLLSTLGFSTGC